MQQQAQPSKEQAKATRLAVIAKLNEYFHTDDTVALIWTGEALRVYHDSPRPGVSADITPMIAYLCGLKNTPDGIWRPTVYDLVVKIAEAIEPLREFTLELKNPPVKSS